MDGLAAEERNALACQLFVEIFGREEGFHLAASRESLITVAPASRGRRLLGPEWTLSVLASKFRIESEIRATGLTAEFASEEWSRRFDETGLPLFLIRKASSLLPFSSMSPKPLSRDNLIALHSKRAHRMPTACHSGSLRCNRAMPRG